jgi:tRNA isopentenyl-2-thiomethyl-A-37 hydroxylase MiaE
MIKNQLSTQPKAEKRSLSLSEFAVAARRIMLAENQRIHDKLCDGALVEAEEFNVRLDALENHYDEVLRELQTSFEATCRYFSGRREELRSKTCNPS